MTANSLARLLAATLTLALAACASQPPPKPASKAAAVTPCPPWVDYPANLHSNANSPYLGCANRANLEQMLVDKHDLVRGRKLGPANGERESSAVKAYEQGKIKLPNSSGASSGATLLLQGGSQGGTQ